MENLLIPYEARRHIGRGRALVFAPHPDDEVFGCGGAIMRHVEAGDPVRVIVLTDGAHELGSAESEHYVVERENESIQAGKILGYGQPEFWRLKDRGLAYGEELIHRLLVAFDDFGPTLVYAPSLHEAHPDHRALAMGAVEAVRRKGDGLQLVMYEVGMPLQPNLLLDISNLAERKAAAMRCFASQLARQPYDQHIAALNRYRTYTLGSEVSAAEAYRVVGAGELANGVASVYESELDRQKMFGFGMAQSDLPLVSVIVRSVGRRSLGEALESIALQTYPNIEVVAVNAMGPGHPELGEWCGRFPLRICETGAPMRRSRAANYGVECAKGQYLAFLDDDDWYLPDHIATLVDALRKSDGLLVSYSAVNCVRKTTDDTWEFLYRFGEPFDATRLLCLNFIPMHAAVFSRKLVEAGCRFDEHLDIYEDWDFWIQAAQKGRFEYTDKVSAVYRISEASGFGAKGDTPGVYQAAVKVLHKWKDLWSENQLFDIARYAAAHSGIHEELRRLTRQVSSQNEHIRSVDSLNQCLQERIQDREQLVVRLEQQLAALGLRATMLGDELHAIKQSRTWRLIRRLDGMRSIMRSSKIRLFQRPR